MRRWCRGSRRPSWPTRTGAGHRSRYRSTPGSTVAVGHRAVGAATEPLARQLREPALDQVQPGAVGGGEVQVHAGMRKQPPVDGGGLVGGGVVADHVHLQLGGDLGVDAGQEPLELDGAVAGGQLGDDLAGGDVQGGVQVGGAVAGRRAWPARGPWQQWQDRGGTVQRLHLGLLVHAQHHRRLGRVQVQADDVADLVDELRIGGQLEGVDQGGLSPNARQIRLIADCDMPSWRARLRVDVGSVDRRVSRVRTSTRSTCSSVIVRGAAGTPSPAMPRRTRSWKMHQWRRPRLRGVRVSMSLGGCVVRTC